MANQTETIRKFVGFLNNPQEQGGFWLPNIQRPFVWKEEQIERLYDSILREYPIGTLLIWKTDSKIKRRRFIDLYHDNLKLTDFYETESEMPKMMVLDGQQRLQSLFIGLKGSYNKKELYFNILSGDVKAPDDIKYEFRFKDSANQSFPWIRFKDLVFTDKRPHEIFQQIEKSTTDLSETDKSRIYLNVETIRDVFCTQNNILYQLVDSIDRPMAYREDDIVEIFIRANSGGTFLGKSDLLFSLLIASWEDADEQVTELLEEINRTGYKFSRDFVLKTCLVLLNKGARYDVEKFRQMGIREQIMTDWDKIADAIKGVKDFIYGNTFLKTDKVISSYLSLVPLIYFRYYFPDDWQKHEADYQNYLIRTSLVGAFSGNPDQLLDKIIFYIREVKSFHLQLIFDVIRDEGRNLEVSQDTILGLNYYKKEIHLLFNLWYGFNYQTTLRENSPQIDHIFPQAELKKIKLPNPDTGILNMMKYPWQKRDQIGNLMLLTQQENGGGGKTDILPEVWFADKSDEYLEKHLIPKGKELWKLDNFEAFVKERNKLILEKFDYLIYQN
ncbi:MAG TPA: DUF262 domain-containing protein [Pyrinomonadaceae bacterium]|jgi:hypothetical protein